MRQPKDVRLFFALWPDAVTRERLQQAADCIALDATARRVPQANLHLTLHFIGNVYLDEMACLREYARQVDAASFSLSIDCQGYFHKPRVGWLGCSNPPDALGDLHRKLGSQLRHCGYRPEQREFHPHVTIARKLGQIGADAAFKSIDWPLHEFALVEVQALKNGVQYRVVERYPLT